MEQKELLHRVDHTLLAQTATWSEIQQICDDGIRYGCASVCIPPSYVQQAAEYRKYRVEKRQTEYRHGDKKRQGRMNLEHAAYRDDRHRIAEEHRARITDEYLCGI